MKSKALFLALSIGFLCPVVLASTPSKQIVFDLSKGEDKGNSDWRIDGAYSEWGDALKKQGYGVRSLRNSSVRASDLEGVSVLVIPEPQNPFSDDERNVILNFVKKGGGVLLIADHRDSDRDNDGWDSPEVFNGWDGKTPFDPPKRFQKSLDAKASFGLEFSLNSKFGDPVYKIAPLIASSASPVLAGISHSGIYVGTSVDVFGATALMGVDGKNYLASSEIGAGRALAYGDSSAFAGAQESSGRRSKHNNWVQLDNAKLAVQMVRWLAHDL